MQQINEGLITHQLLIDEATRALHNPPDQDSNQWTDPNTGQKASPAHALSKFSLDDVAALLVQIEPAHPDLSELARVREALNDVTASGSYPVSVQKLLLAAAQKVDDLVQGKASDPAAILTEVSRLIEAATDPIVTVEPEAIPGPFTAPVESIPAGATEMEVSSSPDSSSNVHGKSGEEDWQVLVPADADTDLVREFITESRELIANAEAALLTLETDPDNMEAVNTVFRAFHTIKGTSAFLGIKRVSELAHRAESLLSRVRDREIRCTGGYADLALRSVDLLKELLQTVQEALDGQAWTPPEAYAELMHLLADPEGAGISSELDETAIKPPRLGDLLVAEDKAKREPIEKIVSTKGEQLLGEAVVRAEAASVTDVARALRMQKRLSGAEQATESSVRIRTDRLDRLIDMVGELVIAQSMLAQDEIVVRGGHLDLLKKVSHSGKIVRDLQDLSMSMRMVPLKATFQKMTRLVRDLAHKSGKLVQFITEGEDTEIDRNMVDVVNDPLVHMVRNAMDHGIERPEVREKNGKPKTGVVRLSAYHAGGNVVIELQDDGRGLDRDKIVAKALEKGVIDSDKNLSESEIFNLIFAPGFSTADKVTDVSGRGVGMDVVKRNVESLRGRVDISSEAGKGSTFSIQLPLTLAITDGMLVKVGDQRYIIPTINIYKNFRPDRQALSTVTGRGELVMLRGELMPMFRLHRLFEIEGAVEDPTAGLLVIVEDGDRYCALLVDELLGQQQVVAKSLGKGIGKVPGISGGAILGDGRVGLILDPAEIIALARQASGT
jgi:two-component system chemotaxis sensor kinase CheA